MQLPCPDFLMSLISSQGRFTLEDLTHTPWKTGISYTNAYHHLQPFHVTTKSFLDIHPLTGTLPCGLKQSVQVTFTLSRDDLGEDTSRIGFAYYVSEGSRELRWGRDDDMGLFLENSGNSTPA